VSKISCFIIAKNEEKNISKAVSSALNVADEVIVIDSGSTDDTCKIAESLGAKVIFNTWNGYLDQKKFGESICKFDWVLNIDADEELSENLQEEIYNVAKSGIIDRYKIYKFNVIILHRKDVKPRFLAPSNCCLRLYNKKYAGFLLNEGDSTHDDVKISSQVDHKKDCFTFINPVLHRSGTSITQLIHKANFYTSQQAEDFLKKGRKVSTIRIALEFPFWFLKAYFERRYFVFGFDGFIDSMIFAFTKFVRLAKVREIYRDQEQEKNI